MWIWKLANFLEPIFEIYERLYICYVIYKKCPNSKSVMCGGYTQELSRAWSVPDLRFYFLVALWKRHRFEFKFDTIGGFWLRIIIVLRNSKKKVCFANKFIANHYNFVEIVKLFIGVIECIGHSWQRSNSRHIIRVCSNSQKCSCDRTISLFALFFHWKLLLLGISIVEHHAVDLISDFHLVHHRALGCHKPHIIHSFIVPISIVLGRHLGLAGRRHGNLWAGGALHRVTQDLGIMQQFLVFLKQIFLHIYLSLDLVFNIFYWKIFGVETVVFWGFYIVA